MKKSTSLSRRGFLAFGGTTAAALAVGSLAGCAPKDEAQVEGAMREHVGEESSNVSIYADGKVSVPELEASTAEGEPITEFSEELSFDMVVVGAGTAGLPAALAAHVYSWGSDPPVPTVANCTPEKIAGFVKDGTLLMTTL